MWKYRGHSRPPFADEPRDGQESVWDYPRPPRLANDSRLVEVVSGSVIIARSTRTIRVLETASPPTFYIPPDDVAVDRLTPAAGASVCEWKGTAGYWALAGNADVGPVGWSYAAPRGEFEDIRDYFSFYPGRVACFVDGERVRPQPGGFYGGWLTDEIAGPVKGEPGTGHW
ncbi:MAG: DUF427 domain-containing protein [Rhodothermales bacterium]|nr:DUF427 domain-containing protein [Rhodothermales bacterium]